MFIEFEKYPFKVTGISIDPKNHYDDYTMVIDLKTDGNKDFRLIAVGDCCSTSVFREYEEHKFEEIVGKVIKSITNIDFNDDFHDNFEEDEFGLYLTPHLLEITFSDDSKFKFMLVNYSNGYYDGWLELSLIDK